MKKTLDSRSIVKNINMDDHDLAAFRKGSEINTVLFPMERGSQTIYPLYVLFQLTRGLMKIQTFSNQKKEKKKNKGSKLLMQ